jgi:hypothetical protein
MAIESDLDSSDRILIIRCVEAQKKHGISDAPVALFLSNAWQNSNNRRLFPGGPTGVIKQGHDNGATVEFKANEILASLVRVEAKGMKRA